METLKITFDGVEYICEKRTDSTEPWIVASYGALYIAKEGAYDFSEYPFNLSISNSDGNLQGTLYTARPGTYSLKVELPSSEPLSFTTAVITLAASSGEYGVLGLPMLNGNSVDVALPPLTVTTTPMQVTVIIPKGGELRLPADSFNGLSGPPTITGAGSLDVDNAVMKISGDCTITGAGA